MTNDGAVNILLRNDFSKQRHSPHRPFAATISLSAVIRKTLMKLAEMRGPAAAAIPPFLRVAFGNRAIL